MISKKIILLALFIICYTITHAQYSAGWMMGTWKGTGGTTTPSGSVTNTIQIDNVSGESFTGTKTSEINGSHAKITISISGFFNGKELYLRNGDVVRKEPENGQWPDCSLCTQVNKMVISRDSLILINSISGCDSRCDAETFYYRLLSEYDSSTQRHLLDRFGRPSDIIGFRPFRPQEDKTVVLGGDNEPQKNDVVAGTTVTDGKRLQQTDDSTRLAQQKKREQEVTDSLNLLQQNEKRRLKDSLDDVARLEQIRLRTEDSLRDVQTKKRQQEIADSINLAQQKEQQRIKDSLDNIARIKQQQIDDSTLLVQQKKRQQEIADSLNLAQRKEQQRIKDSLDNIARIRQQQIDDSTLLAQQKKRQQEIADSINLAQQKVQQRIQDSLDNVARLEQIRKRTEDSLSDVQATKRQQEVTDSLAAVRKQQYNDSLQKAALAKSVPSSTNNTNQSGADKALTSRTNVLLETYHITSPDILIELFDNGEIDGDRVSVYHNNAIIVGNQMLGTKPITLNIHADATNREHEFVLVAENLGSIPPNSALMRITAGKQVYKLSVNTDMKTNAKIVFYYDGN